MTEECYNGRLNQPQDKDCELDEHKDSTNTNGHEDRYAGGLAQPQGIKVSELKDNLPIP